MRIARRHLLAWLAPALALSAQTPPRVRSLRITILTTMLSDGRGIGEWGFAALVQADGRRILFDTGGRPDTIVTNARELGVDLKNIPDAVLSHNHADHTTGLIVLRERLTSTSIHTAKGIF